MSFGTRNPLRMGGALLSSGGVDTGEINWTRGGQAVACLWSGSLAPDLSACPTGAITSGGHTRIVTGAGRLNTVIPHISGAVSVFFYDAGTISLSGLGFSGQKMIGQIAASTQTPASLDVPFTSGLCVAAGSGTPGFSFTFTPAVVQSGAVVGG